MKKCTTEFMRAAMVILLLVTYNSTLIAQTWTSIGGDATYGINSTTAKNSIMPSCAVYNNELYAIWTETPSSGNTQIHIKKYNGTSWVGVGNTPGQSQLNASTNAASNPKLTVYNGYLYAAWNESDVGGSITPSIHVKRYNGSTWTFVQDFTLGENRQNINKEITINAAYVDLAVYNGKLYAAWIEYANSTTVFQLRVAEFDGSLWTRVDGNGNNGLNYDKNNSLSGVAPSLCVYNNFLYVSWLEDIGGKSQLFVKRYDGGSVWTLIGGSGGVGLNCTPTSSAYTPNLISGNNKLYAFWRESNKVHVKQYDGSSWTYSPAGELGWFNSGSGSYNPFGYKFINTNYIAWEENVNSVRQIRVVSFDGTTKTYIDIQGDETLGINQNTAYTANDPALTEWNGDLYALWQEYNSSTVYQIRAKKYPLPPVVESVTVPSNATYRQGQTLNFTVNYSKNVVVSSGSPYIPITLNTGGTVNATYTGGSGTRALTFSYAIVSGNVDNDGIAIGSSIVLPAGCTVRDAASLNATLTLNSVGTTSGVLVDAVAPTITGGLLVSSNKYIDVTFGEGVYGASDGVTALGASRFSLPFAKNTGTATNVIISSVKKSDNTVEGSASALTGGETTVRVFLAITGTPSGAETIEVKPADGTSIYDKAGNAMSASQTTGVKSLNDLLPPALVSAARTDNTHLVVTLSKNSTNITKANDGGFTVCETGVPATTYAVSAIAQGADASHVVLTVADLAISGKEGVTVKYAAGGNGSVQDNAGNAMATNSTGVSVSAWDVEAPTVTGGTLASSNGFVDIYFNEGVYGASDGITPLSASKFSRTFVQNTGTATNVTISSVKKSDNTIEGSASALTGGETTVRVFLTVTGTPSGVETIEIKPANGTSIYDKAGNAVSSSQTTGVKNLYDKLAPTVSITTTASEPTTTSPIPVTITFSETVSDFLESDIVVTNGSKSGFSGSGSSYTVNITPTTAGVVTVNVAAGVAIDGAGNGNTVATQLSRTFNYVVPSVSFTAAAQSSVNESGTMTITAQLSATTGTTVTVPFTVNGTSTATSGTDYSISASPITIAAGSTTGTATITIATDALDEDNETVVVDMGVPTNATKGAITTHTATITDDDVTPTVTFTAASQASAGETGTMTITAQLSAASGKVVTVPFTVNGTSTATSGTDYSISASPITIAAGSTTGTATITIVSDALNEDGETIVVDMGTPTNATKGAITTHTATIANDDAAPTVTFTAATQASSSETGTMTITAQLSAASGKAVTVPFTINGSSTATSGTDYSISASPITIAAGSTTGTATITIVSDALNEDGETIVVDMGTPTNATKGAITTHTATIANDDAVPTVTFTAASQASSGETGTMTITAQLSAVSGKVVTVPFTVNGSSTATSGTDYSISASPITIAAGNTTGTATVTIATDALDENNETIVVDMGIPTNATKGATTTHTATIIDDDSRPVVTSAQSFTIDENMANGLQVGVVTATDADASTTFSSWTITGGNTGNAFTIDATSGILKVNNTSALDREAVSSFALSVTVSDGVNTSATQTVTVNLNDVNDVLPIVTAGKIFTINENLANSTTVGTVVATDGDVTATTYRGWTITDGNTSNAFTIDATSGILKVNNTSALDREAVSSFVLSVTVSDGANTSAAQTVTVNLTDVKDIAPVITAAQVFHVAENSPNGTTVGTVAATDGDITATVLKDWTITDGNGAGYFAINPSTGVITVVDNTGLNSSMNPSFTLTLTVSDGANTSAAQTVSIIVSAVNDENPVITAVQPISINENLANGTAVGQVMATDPDYGTVFQGWAITAGNTGDAFAIDASTGAITVNQSSALDFEATPTFTLSVTVSDGVNTSAAQTVTINLTNLNDNAPEITSTSFEIDENSPKNFVVGKVETTDKDGALNALTVTIKSGNTGDAFAYDNATGNLVVNTVSAVDFEVNPVFNLELEVSDGALSSTKTVQVKLKDVVETGIDEQLFSTISAYPNPTTGVMHIDVPATGIVSYITITDVNGKQVYREQPSSTEQRLTLDMSSMQQGVYFVVLQGKGEKKVIRVVRQ